MKITKQDVENVADRINNITGNSLNQWVKRGKSFKSKVGNYHISYAYGGVALHQFSNEGGAVRDVFGGHMPKRELYYRMQAYCDGLIDAKNT